MPGQRPELSEPALSPADTKVIDAFEHLLARVDKNTVVLAAIEDVVERRLAERRWTSVVGWAGIGAAFATANPSMTFRSLRIERALDEVSRKILSPVSSPPHRRGAEISSVLHVLSEGPDTGGHLRYAVRWVELDNSRSSSFVVTRPGLDPAVLYEVSARHSGRTIALTGSPLDRAARLRAHAAEFDLVICHSHNSDTVPALAFGGDYEGPPVVLMNHGDQAFNMGAGNIATLVTPRSNGADFAVQARSYPERACRVLPIPISGVRRELPRAEAKARLGIAPDRLVAVTLAREPKYVPSPLYPGFVDMVAPVFAEREAILLAVGPRPNHGPWIEAAAILGDRLRVEGMQSDPRLYLDAADVYLDSIPFCSNTSSLEAACRSTPVLTHRPYRGFQQLHSSEGVLDDVAVISGTVEEYRAALRRMLDDETQRRSVGMATAEAVSPIHGESAWRSALEGLYEHAQGADPVRERVSVPSTHTEAIREYAAALAGIESNAPLLWPVKWATTTRTELDRRDRSIGLLRVAAARLVIKARGGGAAGSDAAALLVPGAKRSLSRT